MVNGDKFAFVEFYAPCEYKRYIVVYFRAVVVNILICFIAQSSINNINKKHKLCAVPENVHSPQGSNMIGNPEGGDPREGGGGVLATYR